MPGNLRGIGDCAATMTPSSMLLSTPYSILSFLDNCCYSRFQP